MPNAKLDCLLACLPSPNPDDLLQRRDKDFSITNLSSAGRSHNRIDNRVDLLIGYRDLEFQFRQEIHHVLRTAIKLCMTPLSPEAFDLCHRDALHANVG